MSKKKHIYGYGLFLKITYSYSEDMGKQQTNIFLSQK